MEDAGLVSIGTVGEREYGRRNFMDVTSLFLTEPLLAVRWGQRQLGSVDPSSLASRDDGRATHPARRPRLGRPRRGLESPPGLGRACRRAGPVTMDTAVGPRYRSMSATRFVMSSSSPPTSPTQPRRERRRSSKSSAASTRGPGLAGPHSFAMTSATGPAGGPSAGDARTGQSRPRSTRPPCRRCPSTISASDCARATTASDVKEAASGATTAAIPSDPRRRSAVKFGSCLADEDVDRMLAARDQDVSGVDAVLGEPLDTASE